MTRLEKEIKVLDVNIKQILNEARKLGISKFTNKKFIVDWFWTPGTKFNKEPWYLRIRTNKLNNSSSITWKSKSSKTPLTRNHEEIIVRTDSYENTYTLLERIGLKHYAHQEKNRISWIYNGCTFDLDTYPNMPSYLEIECKNEKKITKMLSLFKLGDHETSNEGERILIEQKYKLDWCDMRFKS